MKKKKNYKIKYNEQTMIWIGNLDSMVTTISNIFIIKPIGLDSGLNMVKSKVQTWLDLWFNHMIKP